MNKQSYNGKTKVCGTCNSFVCNRELTTSQQYVIVEPDCSGKCFGKYKCLTRKAGDRIPNCWSKWDLLNENNKSEKLQDLQEAIEHMKN